MDFPRVIGDDIDPFEEHGLDRRLPWPQAQGIVTERRIIGVQHQSGATVVMPHEIGMVHVPTKASVSCRRHSTNTAPDLSHSERGRSPGFSLSRHALARKL